jgi:hypothetical protein
VFFEELAQQGLGSPLCQVFDKIFPIIIIEENVGSGDSSDNYMLQ